MPIGSDETIDIAIRAKYEGINKAIDELKRLGGQLTAIDKQLRSGLNSDTLNKQFAETARQFDKVAKSVKTGSAESSKSIATVTAQVERLNAQMKKAQDSKGVGFVGAKSDPAGFKKYQETMNNIGTPVMGGAKSFGMLVRNMRNLNASLGDTSKAGIATRASLDAIQNGGSIAFMPALTKSEQLTVKLKSLRANMEGLTQSMQSMAKDRQWIGRQMIEGITLPIVGMGTMAVRSFMSVQAEMIQLKKVTEFGQGKESADAFYDSLVNGTNGIREMSREFGIGRKAATSMFKEVAALGIDGEQSIKEYSRAVSEISMVGDIDSNTAMQFFRTMNALFAKAPTEEGRLAQTRDLMAQMSAVADETSLQLQDLAAAFPEVAPVMEQMGFSAGGVASALAGMYKRGIPATEAAHGLKFALQRLVSPTKDAKVLIDEMGFSFFDSSGKAADADVRIFAMAKNLAGLSNEAKSVQLGEMFGLRQAARMSSFFNDVELGRVQLEEFKAGIRPLAEITSDFARGLIASGEVAGAAVTPLDRYNKALEEIKKDPTTGLKRLKSAFDDFKVQLGATLAPALIELGGQLTKLLDAFTNLPSGFQIAIVAAAGFLAVLGPVYFISGQVTHAMAAMGKMASKVLPKMADMASDAIRPFIGAGQRDFALVGGRNVDLLSRKDRRRLKLGLPTSAQKAMSAGNIGTGASLAPETAATGALTSAKEALTAASVKVAAAEAAETAAHNGNTAAMGAQAVAMNKGAMWDQRMAAGRGSWIDLNTKKTIGYTRALEIMTDQQKAAHFVAPLKPGYTPPVVKPMSKAAMGASMASQYDDIVRKAQAATIAQRQQQAFADLATKAQLLNAKKVQGMSSVPFQAAKTSEVGIKTGSARKQFAELYQSANRTFFQPIGAAAGRAQKQLAAMAGAAKISGAGQALGAFSAGRKGKLGSDAAGVAATAALSPTGKVLGSIGQTFGKLGGSLKIFSGPLGTIVSLFLKFNKVTLILTAVAGIIAFVVMMFKGMKTNWEAVMAKIQPGIDAIKAAFGRLKETFAGVFEKMMGIFGQLGTGAKEGEGAASAFEGVGGIIGTVFEGIAAAIDFVGTVIEFIWPFFERTAYIVKNTVGFIAALFKGEWKQAFMFALAVVYEWVRPILSAFDIVVKGVAQTIASILDLISKIPFVGDSVKGAAEAVESFSDRGIVPALDERLRTGLGGVFGAGTTDPAKKEAKKAGGEIGGTLGDAINSGAGGAADGESWVKKWTDKVVSVLEKELDKIRKSAVDALEKTHEAALKVYDDRIKAIEDQEKAEEKLYKTEEYLSKKRDLLAKRNLDNQNYQKERALAIYEGRYNDARMLDIQEQVNKKAYVKDLADIEDSRAKDLLKETRDNLKDIINLEKDAAKERFDIQKKILEAYLDEILRMTPLTVGEMQSAMDRINQVLSNVGAGWPEYARGAMDVFAKVFKDSNDEIINDFRKSGEDAVLDWVAGFVSADALAAIKKELSKNKGGGGGTDTGATDTAPPPDATYKPPSGKAPEAVEAPSNDFQKYAAASLFGGGAYENLVQKSFKGTDFALMDQTKDKLREIGDEAEYVILSTGELVSGAVLYDPMYAQKYAQDGVRVVASVSEATANAMKNSKDTSREMVKQALNDIGNLMNGSVREVKIYTDSTGKNWQIVNGKLVDAYGKTATYITDESGKIVSAITSDNQEIKISSEKTYTSAQSVFQEMIDKGIKPGTAESRHYIKAINDLGYGVSVIDGKQVLIKINLEAQQFYSDFSAVTRFLQDQRTQNAIAAARSFGYDVFQWAGAYYLKSPDGTVSPFGIDPKTGQWLDKPGYAAGGLVKAQKDGILANIGEGGFDEYVITTDPKYRASNLGYLSAAASKLGVKMASGAAIKAASGGMFTRGATGGSSAEYASNMGGDVYINVDTFIGEEQWFAEMANKYNMKTVPRQRKIEGQQKRVVSSYNDRYRLR